MTTLLDPPVPSPRAAEPAPSRANVRAGRLVTGLLMLGPPIALAIAVPLLWGHALSLLDLVLAAIFYVVTGFGITVGYHRLFTHRSFSSVRWLKILLASTGSMAVEGSVIGWVSTHRRHHVFSDKPGDPHSPQEYGPGPGQQFRGFVHAHVGWLFKADHTSAQRYAPDLLADADTRIISRLFPIFAIASLAAPFFLGWGITASLSGALTAFLWAGLARMMLLHHMTWSINSICHMFGSKPATQKDASTNFAPLGIVSFGEAWHNFHHAFPRSARHGALPHQVDPSAVLIRVFERAGWASEVRWPTAAQLAVCRSD